MVYYFVLFQFLILHYGPSSDAGGWQYDGGVRVIILTANFIHGDCNSKCQALWHQDFPSFGISGIPSISGGITNKLTITSEDTPSIINTFGLDLLRYVERLKLPPEVMSRVKAVLTGHDFSSARAYLIASVPGYHEVLTQEDCCGHGQLKLLPHYRNRFPCRFSLFCFSPHHVFA